MTKSSIRSARLTIIAGVATAMFVAACGKPDPATGIANAKAYLEKRDTNAAAIELKGLLAAHPDNAEARFLLAKALLDSGDIAAAEIEIQKSIEHHYAGADVAPLHARILLASGKAEQALKALDTAPAPSKPEDIAEFEAMRGHAYYAMRDAKSARARFEAAVAKNPNHVSATIGLARLVASTDGITEAEKLIDKLIENNPTNSDAWHFKGDILRATNHSNEALAAYDKAIEFKPKQVLAYASAIMLSLAAHDLDGASGRLVKLEKAVGNNPVTTYMKGVVAFAKKDFPSAKTSVEALLKSQPENPQALQLAGAIAYEMKSDLQAQEYLAKSIQKAPQLDFGRRVLVMSYLRSGQPTKAIAALKPVLEGRQVGVWAALAGDAYLHSGDAKTATEFYKKAVQANPDDVRAKTAVAMATMRVGNADQAFADLEKIAAADSGTTADMALIASAMSQRQFDKALNAIEVVAKKTQDSPVPYHLRGAVLAAKKDLAGAAAQYEKALQINPAHLPSAVSLAQIDFANKKPEKAKARFEGVLAKEPKNAEAMLALAELHGRTGGKPEEVTQMLEKAVAAAPNESAPRVALIGQQLRTRNIKLAVKAAQDAAAALPDRTDVLEAAAQAFRVGGDSNQALATYGKLTTLLPNATQPYLAMAEIHLAAKNKESAREALGKGLALHPDALPLLRAQIMLEVADGRFDESLARARDIQKRHASHPAGYVLEGDIRMAQKMPDKAVDAYASGLKAAPNSDLAQRHYAALSVARSSTEAERFAATWLKAHGDDFTFRLFVAETAIKSKDMKRAIDQYKAVLAANPSNAAVMNNLAWALGEINDPQALVLAEKANKIAPNQPPILDTYGSLLVKAGKSEQGLELLSKAVAAAPEQPDIRFNYAKALALAGKKADARREFEFLQKLGAGFARQSEVADQLKGL